MYSVGPAFLAALRYEKLEPTADGVTVAEVAEQLLAAPGRREIFIDEHGQPAARNLPEDT